MSVCGTGTYGSQLAAFLDSVKSVASVLIFPPHHASELKLADLPMFHPLRLDRNNQQRLLCLSFCVPLRSNDFRWYWNLNQLSIAYAFVPRLRSRLTLSRTNLPQETLDFRWAGFSPALRYSCQHSLFPYKSTMPFSTTSTLYERSPLPHVLSYTATASVPYF